MSKGRDDMARVKFLRAFDWRPPERRQSVISFEAGKIYTVRRACADAAFADRAAMAVPSRRPGRRMPALPGDRSA